MTKLLIFGLLVWLFRNPFLALLVLLLIIYILDRRFVGVLPSMTKPFRRSRTISKLKQQLMINPNDMSAKIDLSRLLIEKKNNKEANRILESILPQMDHSAEVWDDLGTTYLHLGEVAKGEEAILKAVEINPRVKYGEPYLRLSAVYSTSDHEKALHYLQQFRHIHSSSCKAYYLLGNIYKQMGNKLEAKQAYQECIMVYRTLPKYKRRQERKWVVQSLFHNLIS